MGTTMNYITKAKSMLKAKCSSVKLSNDEHGIKIDNYNSISMLDRLKIIKWIATNKTLVVGMNGAGYIKIKTFNC